LQGLGFRVQGVDCRVLTLSYRAWAHMSRVQGVWQVPGVLLAACATSNFVKIVFKTRVFQVKKNLG